MGNPNFKEDFPLVDSNLKIKSDLNNRVHGPHYDILQSINSGTDQIRVSESGDVLGGTTNIGKTKINW